MNSTALVTSDDLILRSEARGVLNEMQIACICSGTAGFDRAVASSKFEAILLDMPADEALAAIRSIRNGKLNRYCIVLSFVGDGQSAAAAWAAGANFTIRRTSEYGSDLKKAFQSAHGLILREKRRYHRQPISIPVEILSNGKRFTGQMLDISERGACVECAVPMPKQAMQLRFCLPGSQTIRVEALPAWARGAKIGIQFTAVDEAARAAISQWLISQLDPKVISAGTLVMARSV